ncbi:MAG: hypothetical protein RLZZ15_4356 [Verrucomicrobiota bacterium]|jgi:Ca-activated chloride channel family protein
MNATKLSPDDPRLTAYALGELDPAERAAVEAALTTDPAARAAVEEIRVLSAHLAAALAGEALPPAPTPPPFTLPEETREAVQFPAVAAVTDGRRRETTAASPRVHASDAPTAEENRRGPLGALLQFPRFYFVAGGALAAGFALMIALRSPPGEPAPRAAKLAEREVATREQTAGGSASATTTTRPSSAPVLALVPENAAAAAPVAPTAPAPNSAALASMVAIEPLPSIAPDALAVAAFAPPPARLDLREVVSPEISAAIVAQGSVNAPPVSFAPTVTSAPASPSAPSPLASAPPPANTVASVPPTASVASTANSATATTPLATAPAAARDNDFLAAADHPISTFSIDADTASYPNIRRLLQSKRLPAHDAVRIEELLNYFPFHYSPPRGDAPFAATMEVADAPWAPAHRLVRIGLKAREVASAARPPASLVIVVDALATHRAGHQLAMIRESLQWLATRLRPDDRVALVTCNGAGAVLLPSTPVRDGRAVLAALDALAPGASNSRARGLQLGYELAQAAFLPGGANRVVLCTDGNSAVTITAEGALARFIEARAKAGVALTAYGFGMGLYRDPLLELLADTGRGNYAYVDSRREAEKSLAEEINGPAVTIAKDVNIQVEFNPATVARYRLIGYENRALKKDDFSRDAFEAGEIDAGRALTALFEIVPVSGASPGSVAADLARATDPNELLEMKVRYKKPGLVAKQKLSFPLFDSRARFVDASADFKFAAAVAGFGMILRDSPHKGDATLAHVVEWAAAGVADDPGGHRGEFIELARGAESVLR